MKKTLSKKTISKPPSEEYGGLIGGIAELLEAARRTAARTVNALMTATYWEIGRRIVEFEQGGEKRAEYGEALLQRLAQDLNAKFGRGFSYPNVNKFRQFYLAFPSANILSTPSIESTESILSTPSIELRRQKSQTPSGQFAVRDVAGRFPCRGRITFDCSRSRAYLRAPPRSRIGFHLRK
jgi:hypothetical protein